MVRDIRFESGEVSGRFESDNGHFFPFCPIASGHVVLSLHSRPQREHAEETLHYAFEYF